MQSIFRLPWCSDPLSMRAGEKDAFAPPPAQIEISMPKQGKRKRAISSDPLVKQQSSNKRQRPATAIAPGYATIQADETISKAPIAPATISPAQDDTRMQVDSIQDSVTVPAESTDVKRGRLQQTIENQINLQILLKHNELRLIDQELAKCQVALEQLRRCELRPFPGQDGFDYSLSAGTGSAVLPSPGFTQPTHAAPYGVTEGPYTRHYRRWLLQDDDFESRPIQIVQDDSHGRSTRHAGARKSLPGTFMSPLRHSADYSGLPTLPVPTPKRDSSMPLVLRRSTDGKLVKLVCNNCNRGNMSSIQGFLNHCRIAHKVIYESHDAAAVDCGRILDDAEIASLPAESQSMPAPKPVVRHAPRAIAVAPVSTTAPAVIIPTSTSVHPLNKAGTVLGQEMKDASKVEAKPVQASVSAQPAHHASAPFKAAAGLPKLSALFARRNAGGDLEQAAIDARRRSEFGPDELISPAALTPGSPAVMTPLVPIARRAGKAPAPKRPRQSYFAPASTEHDQQLDGTLSPNDHGMNFSPNTVYSNPGLVSDVEDDDNGSASEEESAPDHPIAHPLGISHSCADVDISVAVEEGLGQHGVVIRRNSMLGADDSLHNDSNSTRKIGGQR